MQSGREGGGGRDWMQKTTVYYDRVQYTRELDIMYSKRHTIVLKEMLVTWPIGRLLINPSDLNVSNE